MIRFCLYHPNGDLLFQLYLHPLASDTDFWASKACLLSFLLYFRLLLVQQDHRKYVRSFHTFPTVLYRYIFQTFAAQGFWLEFLPLFQVENIFGYLPIYTHLFQTYSHAYNLSLYTSDAADDLLCVDLGGLRIIK